MVKLKVMEDEIVVLLRGRLVNVTASFSTRARVLAYLCEWIK
jgi:hypothetical protein